MQRGGAGRRATLLLASAAIGLAAPGPAGAATQIGEVFTPASNCGTNFASFQTSSPGGQYTVPSSGVITAWSYQGGGLATQLRFKVARPAGGNDLTIVGASAVQAAAAGQLNNYAVTIPVQPGDVIGLRFASPGACQRPGATYGYLFSFADPEPGTTNTYSPASGQFDVAATLEADCDSDGLGDESQDLDTVSCNPVPETTISKGPKDKTKKKSATFEFSSSLPGSTFECSLDGAPFTGCASPATFKVKKGKRTFAVRATSGGQTDPSAATDDWKVKKKKK